MSKRTRRAAERPRRQYWKWAVSLLVCVQLLAVFAEPFRFFTRSMRGTSPAADPLRWVLAPYVEFAYLNHGYFFFAPEPGPSHLMDCRLQFDSGEEGRLVFPDRRAQWPRLLYHRHFMLAEFLHQLHVPPFEPELAADNPRLAEDWRAERQLYERVRGSMVDHLLAKYEAQAATIDRLEHRLPSDDEVLRQRLPLDSPSLYFTLPDGPPLDGPPLDASLPVRGQPPGAIRAGAGVLLAPQPAPGPRSERGGQAEEVQP
ncbi:MAG: hypothetical protein KDA45_10550 [Planctomycetales bacterium]|nr:hypothetical protein [Planctomycetales bacterium]